MLEYPAVHHVLTKELVADELAGEAIREVKKTRRNDTAKGRGFAAHFVDGRELAAGKERDITDNLGLRFA